MIVETIVVGSFMVNSYIIGCEETGKGFVVDPGGDEDLILTQVEKHNLTIEKILLTHGHIDHIGAVAEVQQKTNAGVFISADDRFLLAESDAQSRMFGLRPPGPFEIESYLKDGEQFTVGNLNIKVISTPGHTPGSVSFLVNDILISGDTLFEGSIGRTDFPGGSFADIKNSIKTKLYVLPDETVVFCGHGPSTTIEYEKLNNPFVR